MPEQDFERLASAMIVSKVYRSEVLDPQTRVSALASGYQGQTFGFTKVELTKIIEVDASTFTTFGAALDKIKKDLNP